MARGEEDEGPRMSTRRRRRRRRVKERMKNGLSTLGSEYLGTSNKKKEEKR